MKQKRIRQTRSIFLVVLGVIFLSAVAVFAGKGGEKLLSYLRPSVEVTLSGTVSRDQKKVDLEKAGLVNPGEVLRWTIASENKGEGKATGYKTIGQIPKGTAFVAGSANAEGSAIVRYSVDQGKSFSEKPMIKEKQADGSEKLVPASVDMYTQIQFEWKQPLNSGEKLTAF